MPKDEPAHRAAEPELSRGSTGTGFLDDLEGPEGAAGEDAIPGSLVVDALQDLVFPLDKRAIVATAGHRQLRFPSGRSVPLSELLAETTRDEFESVADLAEAIRSTTGSARNRGQAPPFSS